jgi:hypothetical protein
MCNQKVCPFSSLSQREIGALIAYAKERILNEITPELEAELENIAHEHEAY